MGEMRTEPGLGRKMWIQRQGRSGRRRGGLSPSEAGTGCVPQLLCCSPAPGNASDVGLSHRHTRPHTQHVTDPVALPHETTRARVSKPPACHADACSEGKIAAVLPSFHVVPVATVPSTPQNNGHRISHTFNAQQSCGSTCCARRCRKLTPC